MTMYLGIDPGLGGAMVLLDAKSNIVGKWVNPTTDESMLDIPTLSTVFRSFMGRDISVFLEQVSARPKQGVSSVFKFGRVYGIAEALVVANGLSYVLVTPQRWQKGFHAGMESTLDAKAKSRAAVESIFPGVDLRATKRSKIPHSGLVDALLIAEYGRRLTLPRPV